MEKKKKHSSHFSTLSIDEMKTMILTKKSLHWTFPRFRIATVYLEFKSDPRISRYFSNIFPQQMFTGMIKLANHYWIQALGFWQGS